MIPELFQEERSAFEKKYKIQIIADSPPASDTKLLNIYNGFDYMTRDLGSALCIFSHKFGFQPVYHSINKFAILQRFGFDKAYIPNVSEFEIIKMIDDLINIRNIYFNRSTNLNRRSLLIDFSKSVGKTSDNSPRSIEKLSESQKRLAEHIAKMVFIGRLFDVDTPYVKYRNQIKFSKYKNGISVKAPFGTKFLNRIDKINLEQHSNTKIENLISSNSQNSNSSRNLDIIKDKTLYFYGSENIIHENLDTIIKKLFNIDISSKINNDFTFYKKQINPYRNTSYDVAISSCIPSPIRNYFDIVAFKKNCELDIPNKSLNPNRRAQLISFIRSKNFIYPTNIENLCQNEIISSIYNQISNKEYINFTDLDSYTRRNYLILSIIKIISSICSPEYLKSLHILHEINNLHFAIKSEVKYGVNCITIDFFSVGTNGFYPVFSSSARL